MKPVLKLVGDITPLDATADALAARAAQYALNAKAESTKRAYLSDWAHFAAWCARREEAALPAEPDTVALYLTAHADVYKVATLNRRLVSIAQMHQMNGFPDPPTRHSTVRDVWKGIKRENGTAPAAKAPLLTDDLQAILNVLPAGPLGVRDRALLLIGFAGAFRRSELVALDVADVSLTRAGLTITIRRSKTDQEGKGRKVAVPVGTNEQTCPVRAYKAWLVVSGIKRGSLFRGVDRFGQVLDMRLTGHAVWRIVKRSAERAGLDPSLYAGHSLRAGLATSAAARGVPRHKIRAQTGHKSDAMLDRYIRDSQLFEDNAASGAGL